MTSAAIKRAKLIFSKIASNQSIYGDNYDLALVSSSELNGLTDRGVLLFVSRTTLKIEIYEVKGK